MRKYSIQLIFLLVIITMSSAMKERYQYPMSEQNADHSQSTSHNFLARKLINLRQNQMKVQKQSQHQRQGVNPAHLAVFGLQQGYTLQDLYNQHNDFCFEIVGPARAYARMQAFASLYPYAIEEGRQQTNHDFGSFFNPANYSQNYYYHSSPTSENIRSVESEMSDDVGALATRRDLPPQNNNEGLTDRRPIPGLFNFVEIVNQHDSDRSLQTNSNQAAILAANASAEVDRFLNDFENVLQLQRTNADNSDQSNNGLAGSVEIDNFLGIPLNIWFPLSRAITTQTQSMVQPRVTVNENIVNQEVLSFMISNPNPDTTCIRIRRNTNRKRRRVTRRDIQTNDNDQSDDNDNNNDNNGSDNEGLELTGTNN